MQYLCNILVNQFQCNPHNQKWKLIDCLVQHTKQLLEENKTPWSYQTQVLITTINLTFVVRHKYTYIFVCLLLFLFVCFFLEFVFVFFLFLNDRARRQIIYPLDQLRGNAPSERILKEKVETIFYLKYCFILCSDAISKNSNE